MGPRLRLWWRQLEAARAGLNRIHRWHDPRPVVSGANCHRNPNHTLVLGLAGVVRVEGCDGRLDLAPGDLLMIAAGVWHHHCQLRRGSAWFGLGSFPLWSDLAMGDEQTIWRGRLPLEPSRSLLGQALWAPASDQARALVLSALDVVLREEVEALLPHHAAVTRMFEAIATRSHLGLDVEDLVRLSGMSRSRAFAVFRAEMGMSPQAALRDVRLRYAEALLMASQPIGEVAVAVGFSGPDAFSRAWHRFRGLPPRVWPGFVRRGEASGKATTAL